MELLKYWFYKIWSARFGVHVYEIRATGKLPDTPKGKLIHTGWHFCRRCYKKRQSILDRNGYTTYFKIRKGWSCDQCYRDKRGIDG